MFHFWVTWCDRTSQLWMGSENSLWLFLFQWKLCSAVAFSCHQKDIKRKYHGRVSSSLNISGSSVSAEPSRPVQVTSNWAFQLVNDSLAFSRAESFCRSQFSSLVHLDQFEDNEGLLELLHRTGVHPPLWVKNPSKAASTAVALSKQCELKKKKKRSHQIKEPFKLKSFSSSPSSSSRYTVHHINLPHGGPSGLCSRQHVFSCPVFHQHLSSCPVEPRLHWGVHYLLLRCACLYQWVSATRPAGQPRTCPPGSYHPWKAPPLQDLVR